MTGSGCALQVSRQQVRLSDGGQQVQRQPVRVSVAVALVVGASGVASAYCAGGGSVPWC